MDAIVWLVCSWVVVGLLSYIFVTRVGNVPQFGSTESNRQISSVTNNERSDWFNEVIAWLSTYKSFPVGLSEHWIKSLNEVAKKICVPGQHEVVFEETRPSLDSAHHPRISNIESCRNSNGQLVIRAHLEVPLTVLRVVASENPNNYTTITNYNASVAHLEGDIEARLAFIADEVYLMSCFNNCPEMKITLANADKPNEALEYNAKLDNTIRKCITSAVMSINFHEYIASLRDEAGGKSNYFSDNFSYNEQLASSLHSPSNNVNYDRSLFVYQPNQQQQASQKQNPPNKIRIKLIKAQRLNIEDKSHLQPYVTIEIDEPGQKFTSTPSKTANPQWDQNAEFSINELSDEVLFEVYGLPEKMADKNKKFLGLAIAGLSEMRKSNERVHNLQLQSRPYQNDKVSGMLTIQSEFFYDPYEQSGNAKKKSTEKAYNKNAFTFTEPYSTKEQLGNSTPPYEYRPKQQNYHSAARVSVNEPNQLHNEGHSVLDNVTNRGMDMTELVDRPHREPVIAQQTYPHPTLKHTTHQQSSNYVSADENDPPQWIELENAQLISDDPSLSDNERGRSSRKSRAGKRERSFFGELRDRLTGGHSRAKKRAKSLDAQNPMLDEAPSEPPSRDQSQVRYEQLSRTGTLERGRSANRSPAFNDAPTASSKLVLELGDDYHEKKYYYIPDYIEEQLRATRIMKRGKKLHISNDHSFVAVKSKGNVVCDVCGGKITTNFVKQAYQCRDCRLVTHKHCHRRTGSVPCPSSSINDKYVVEDVNWEQLLSRFQEGEEFISGENL